MRGSNAACDTSCPREDAILNNPRGLVFSEDNDLYIVDAGGYIAKSVSIGEGSPNDEVQ